MSIVLDALRRGRGKPTTKPASSSAQTDAVLKTLGYGRVHHVSRLKRVTRVAAALAAGVVVGILLWTTVVWLTRTYLQRASAIDEAAPTKVDEAAVTKTLESPATTLPRASLTIGEGNATTPDAIDHLLRTISINPQNVRARNSLGIGYLAQGKRDEAAAQFHSAHTADPKDAATLVNLAAVEMASGRQDQARGSVTRALQLEPRSAEAHYNLAVIEEAAGNAARAQNHYREFLQYGADAYPSLAIDVRRRIDK